MHIYAGTDKAKKRIKITLGIPITDRRVIYNAQLPNPHELSSINFQRQQTQLFSLFPLPNPLGRYLFLRMTYRHGRYKIINDLPEMCDNLASTVFTVSRR